MKIYFKRGFPYKQLIKRVFEKAIFITGNQAENIVVNLQIVSEDEIKELNKKHRKVDKVTDVLSFPLLDISYDKKLKNFEKDRDLNGCLELGDIVICKEKVKNQAKEYGHSFKRELVFLSLHGLLHLLGYDHIKQEDEKIMSSIAKNILLNFNIKR